MDRTDAVIETAAPPVRTGIRFPRSSRRLAAVWSILRRYPVFPALIFLMMVVSAAFAPLLAPHDPGFGDLRASTLPPVWLDGGVSKHVLGADPLGRDILSRVIFGARISTLIAGTVLLAGGIGGTVTGLVAGFRGGWVDELAMRAVDFTLAMHSCSWLWLSWLFSGRASRLLSFCSSCSAGTTSRAPSALRRSS